MNNAFKQENQPVGLVNTVADSDNEPDGCWTVDIDMDPWECLSNFESQAITLAEPKEPADEEPKVLEMPEADASAVIMAILMRPR
jgi:hypothetical protein